MKYVSNIFLITSRTGSTIRHFRDYIINTLTFAMALANVHLWQRMRNVSIMQHASYKMRLLPTVCSDCVNENLY